MQLDDGRELLLRFSYPLPVTTAGVLMEAVAKAADRLGYSNVHLITNGPHVGSVAGTPPAGGPNGPDQPPAVSEHPSRRTPT